MRLWFVEVNVNGYVMLNMRGALDVCTRALHETLSAIPERTLRDMGVRLDVTVRPL